MGTKLNQKSLQGEQIPMACPGILRRHLHRDCGLVSEDGNLWVNLLQSIGNAKAVSVRTWDENGLANATPGNGFGREQHRCKQKRGNGSTIASQENAACSSMLSFIKVGVPNYFVNPVFKSVG